MAQSASSAGPPRAWQAGVGFSPFSTYNMINGNVFSAVPLVGIDPVGPPIGFSLYHNSGMALANESGQPGQGFTLGNGWSTSYSGRVQSIDPNTVVVHEDDGTRNTFSLGSGALWNPPPGVFDRLVHDTTSRAGRSRQRAVVSVVVDRANAVHTETTDVPDSTQDIVRSYVGGRLGSARSASNVLTQYLYDGFGRQWKAIDGRGNVSETSYDSAGRVQWTKDGALNQTTYAYYLASESGTGVYPGRLKSVQNPASKVTYLGYNDRGQTIRTWGDVPYPTEEVFDPNFGERTALRTWQGGTGWSNAAWPAVSDPNVTTWAFDPATGLLNAKTYADGASVAYTYTSDNELYTRRWARDAATGQVTTYGYDPNSGELTDVQYNAAWGMTNLVYSHDRLGRRASVTDAAGTRTFGYDPATLAPTTETFSGGLFNGVVIAENYQTSGGGGVAGRWSGVSIGSGYSAAYGYDGFGRMNHVTGPGLPTGDGSSNGAWYAFDPNSDLTDKLEFKDSAGVVKGYVDWSYETERDLVASVENRFGASGSSTLISRYAYANDSRARRTSVVRTGIAFASGSSGHMDKWGYNDRNELTSSRRYAGLDPNSPGTAEPNLNRDYAYDPIGNRVTSAEGADAWTYTRNSVNQYPAVDMGGLGGRYLFDPDGNLKQLYAASDVDGDGDVDQDDVDALLFCFGLTQAECSLSPEEFARADADGDGTSDQDDVDAILYYFGATVSDTLNAILTWDGENRLVEWRPRSPKSGSKKCEFKYDYMGRRVEKKVYTYSGSAWSLTTTRRFIWRDWLRLMELDGSGNVLRKWTWGRDLSGTLEGAGGIGGLLSVQDANGTPSDPNDDMNYVYFFDANGNVGQVVDLLATSASTCIKAQYEYDAYGNVTYSAGSYASANAIRFSTKPWDDETGMGDWGRRLYDAPLGRWVSRDPLGELGGINLYSFTANCPPIRIDPDGRRCELARKCDDCWDTCTSASGQAALGTDQAGVLCRADGCLCACTKSSALPGGPPGSPEDIKQKCALLHEELHISQKLAAPLCYTCSSPPGGGLGRLQQREGCALLGEDAECAAYEGEVKCLLAGLNAACTDEFCKGRVREAIANTITSACAHGCGLSLGTAIAAQFALTPQQAKQVELLCKQNLKAFRLFGD